MKEISNTLKKEFKVTIIKMITKVGRRMDENSENVNKQLKNVNNEPIRVEE